MCARGSGAVGALRRAEARTCQLDLSGGAIAGCPPGLHGGSRGWQSGGGPHYMLRCLPFMGPRSWILGFGAVLGPVRPCFSLPCLCPRFLALGPGGALAVLMVGLPRSAKQLDPSLSPETAQRLPKAPRPLACDGCWESSAESPGSPAGHVGLLPNPDPPGPRETWFQLLPAAPPKQRSGWGDSGPFVFVTASLEGSHLPELWLPRLWCITGHWVSVRGGGDRSPAPCPGEADGPPASLCV